MAQIELTDELKALLIGSLPMDDTTIKFVPEMYERLEIDEATREYIAPIVEVRQWTNKEVMAVKEQQSREANQNKKQANKAVDRRAVLINLIKDAIVNIDNFRNAELIEIPFEGIESLDIVPEAMIINIFDKLTDLSGFDKVLVEQLIKSKKTTDAVMAIQEDKEEPVEEA